MGAIVTTGRKADIVPPVKPKSFAPEPLPVTPNDSGPRLPAQNPLEAITRIWKGLDAPMRKRPKRGKA